MNTKKTRNLAIGAAFGVLCVCVFALAYIIIVVVGKILPAQTPVTTASAQTPVPTASEVKEDTKSLLEGLLTIEAARRNPGLESNKALQSYLETIQPIIPKMRHDQAVNSVDFSSNGKWVVSGSDDGTARVWDITTKREISRTTIDGIVRAVDFSPDGSRVAQGACEGFSENFVNCGKAIVRVWDVSTKKEFYQARSNMALITLKFTPDGKKILITGNREGIQLWDLNSDTLSSPFKPDLAGAEKIGQAGGYIYALDVDPLGRWFAAGSVVAVQVWDLEKTEELSKYPLGASSVAFSPDGELLASASNDIRIWNAKTGLEVLTRIQLRQGEGVSSMEFSPDGKFLAAASSTMVRVWEISTGLEVSQISFNGIVSSIAFSPDGKWIVSGGNDNTVSLSRWNSDELITEICSQLSRNFTHEEWKQNFGDEPYHETCPNLPVPDN